MPTILSINISDKKGVIKTPVEEAVLLEGKGIEGDAHCGADEIKQVSLLADESAEKMRKAGADVVPGSFAENITVEGMEINKLPIGTRFKIGETLMEMTKIGKECHHGCAIKEQTGSCVMPTEGIFAKVLRGGTIRKGDEIRVL